VPVPITPAAIAADSALSNARAFDLMVTQNGERWNVSTMQGVLATGGNYNGGLYNTSPDSLTEVSPALGDNHDFDSSVTTPMWTTAQQAGALDVLGSSDYPSAAGAGTVGVLSGTNINIAWGDKQGNLNTTTTTNTQYRIARITITGNTGGFVDGYSAGNVQLNNAQAFSAYLPIRGDINADHVVDQSDLTVIVGHWQQTNVGYANGDLNMDGIVDQSDLTQIVGSWQNTIAHPGEALGSLVPEPSALALLAIGGAATLRRRRRA
jgi:hypothetical protein